MRFKYKQYTNKHTCYIIRDNLRNFPGDFPSTHNWQAYWQYIFSKLSEKKPIISTSQNSTRSYIARKHKTELLRS